MTLLKTSCLAVLTAVAAIGVSAPAAAYPPAVGIVGDHRSCTSCHESNGPWKDESASIIDILDAATRRSLRRRDGSFPIEVERGQAATVLTVIGRRVGDVVPAHAGVPSPRCR